MDLRRISVENIKPYELLFSPLYVYFQKNQKFIGVRGPLDFFDESQLEKLKFMQTFYTTRFVDQLVPYESAASSVRSALLIAAKEGEDAPAPFEVSDTVLSLLANVWTDGIQIEPFFVIVFVQKLLGPLPGELLKAAREKSVSEFEKGLMQSAWAVFLALHLGRCDLNYLEKLRTRIFASAQTGDEIEKVARKTLVTEETEVLNRMVFSNLEDVYSKKLADRMEKMEESYVKEGASLRGSIFGEGGFSDV